MDFKQIFQEADNVNANTNAPMFSPADLIALQNKGGVAAPVQGSIQTGINTTPPAPVEQTVPQQNNAQETAAPTEQVVTEPTVTEQTVKPAEQTQPQVRIDTKSQTTEVPASEAGVSNDTNEEKAEEDKAIVEANGVKGEIEKALPPETKATVDTATKTVDDLSKAMNKLGQSFLVDGRVKQMMSMYTKQTAPEFQKNYKAFKKSLDHVKILPVVITVAVALLIGGAVASKACTGSFTGLFTRMFKGDKANNPDVANTSDIANASMNVGNGQVPIAGQANTPINNGSVPTQQPSQATFDKEAWANEVWTGKYGQGPVARKQNLIKAGLTPQQADELQDYINKSPRGQAEIAAMRASRAAQAKATQPVVAPAAPIPSPQGAVVGTQSLSDTGRPVAPVAPVENVQPQTQPSQDYYNDWINNNDVKDTRAQIASQLKARGLSDDEANAEADKTMNNIWKNGSTVDNIRTLQNAIGINDISGSGRADRAVVEKRNNYYNGDYRNVEQERANQELNTEMAAPNVLKKTTPAPKRDI